MEIDLSLLGKDGVPSIEELRAHFQKHDFTQSTPLSANNPVDGKELNLYKQATRLISNAWDHTLDAGVNWHNYSPYHPVVGLKELNQERIAEAVVAVCRSEDALNNALTIGMNALQEQLEEEALGRCTVEELLEGKISQQKFDEIIDDVADEALEKMISLLQQVQNVPEMLDLCKNNPVFEDFRQGPANNDLINHYRSWYHTQTNTGSMLSFDTEIENTYADPEAEKQIERVINDVGYNQLRDTFCATLDDMDNQIFRLREQNCSQSEIANMLGLSSQGTVSKKLKKIEARFRVFLRDIDNQ